MSPTRVMFLIIASYDQPAYHAMIAMRRKQFAFNRLPYLIVSNGPRDDVPIAPDEIHLPYPLELRPHLFAKFCIALRRLDLRKFDFIVRVNVSTYVRFSTLMAHLATMPREKVVAGHLWIDPLWAKPSREFLSGTLIILSADAATAVTTMNLDDQRFVDQNDDVALSWALNDLGFPLTDLSGHFVWMDFRRTIPDGREIDRLMHMGRWFAIRIRNEHDRETIDVAIWRALCRRIDGFEFVPTKASMVTTST